MAKTLAQILAGEDMEGGENYCDDIYNISKNHWYGAVAPGSPVNGMIWIKDDGTNWVYTGGAWVALGVGGGGVNLITNSSFGVGSQSVLTDIDAQIDVTDITNGVCTTVNTQNLQVGDLVQFNGGGTTGTNVYEVIALVADTTFTIHDVTITDPANVNCDEATPAFLAADSKAPDTWTKTDTLDLYRWFNHPTFHNGMYGLKVIKGADGPEYLNASGDINSEDYFCLRFRGREVTFGCWIYSTVAADNVKLQINDSDGTTESAFVAANTLTWVEVTRTCGATITSFTPRILFDGDTADEAYISRPMLVFGSSIGVGNYQPKLQEWVRLEIRTSSNELNALIGSGDVASEDINLEADSNGVLPKGARAVRVHARIRDSGSAANACYLTCSPNAGGYWYFTCDCGGLTDDQEVRKAGEIGMNPSGDYQYGIAASDGATFDIETFQYMAVLVN